jgi:hypothetical protein
MALELNPVQLGLLERFHEHHVQYLIIGSHAKQFHGCKCATDDLAILLGNALGNPKRTVTAIESLGLHGSNRLVERLASPHQQLKIRGGYATRLMTSIDDFKFREGYERRVLTLEQGITVSIMGLADLLANKAALNGRIEVDGSAGFASVPPAKCHSSRSEISAHQAFATHGLHLSF